MLSMLEEVVLLAVDEKSGGLRSTREFGPATAGFCPMTKSPSTLPSIMSKK